jgi:hypothetical protein
MASNLLLKSLVEIFGSKTVRSIQIKVLAMLSRWIVLNYDDFIQDHSLDKMLMKFIKEARSCGFIDQADRLLRITKTAKCSLLQSFKFLKFLEIDAGPIIHIDELINSWVKFGPIINNSNRVAEYLTHSSYLLMKATPFQDYIDKFFISTCGIEDQPNYQGSLLDILVSRSNYIHNWTIIEIASAPKFFQAKMVQCFIVIAKNCLSNFDFNTSFFITMALLSTSIQNLGQQVWAKIDDKSKADFQILKTLVHPSNNMRNYRKLKQSAKSPFIPFIPSALKDLSDLSVFHIKSSSEDTMKSRIKDAIDFEAIMSFYVLVNDMRMAIDRPFSFNRHFDQELSHLVEYRISKISRIENGDVGKFAHLLSQTTD